MIPADQLPSGLAGLWKAVYDLRRDLKEMRAARSTARIGTLRVYTPAGDLLVEAGPVPDTHLDGSTQYGIRMRREDGTLALTVAAVPSVSGSDTQSVTIYDRNGKAVVGDDPVSGGLAGPHIPIPFGRSYYLDWAGTSSATFADLHQATINRQQASAYLVIAHTNDTAGATGQIQVTANGTVVTGSLTATSFSATTATIGPFTLPGDYGGTVDLRVQARLASGTGTVRCEVIAASEIQA